MMGLSGAPTGKSKIMPQKLLDVLMLGRCSHEFSWPRRAADGHYYQVCLLCAAEFKYDWNTMQRVERLEQDVGRGHERDPADAEPPRRHAFACEQRNRVARLDLQSRGELLVERDRAWSERPPQEAERPHVREVGRRDGEDGTCG